MSVCLRLLWLYCVCLWLRCSAYIVCLCTLAASRSYTWERLHTQWSVFLNNDSSSYWFLHHYHERQSIFEYVIRLLFLQTHLLDWKSIPRHRPLLMICLPPPPLPKFPNTGSCQWSFDESTRVLIADFSVGKNGDESVVTLEDSKFLFEMHERTDITVISRGLLNMSKIY